jgi:uncharacterized protein YgbK (DUF1537 family)
MEWCVVVAFDDGEVRRHIVEADDMSGATRKASTVLSARYDAERIVGVQIDRLDYPYFV